MKKSTKLKLCNWGLLIVSILMLGSSVQMEICGGKPFCGFSFISYTVLHVVVGITMIYLVFKHLGMHRNLLKMRHEKHNPSKQGQMLMFVFNLVLLSGIVATCYFFCCQQHSIIGAIHGKIGFLFLVLCLVHVKRHINFFFHGSGSAKRQ